ncbi:hypothetical protein CEP54_011684 [Fusarium duplospermum]|uniref:Uncharacterized protein n=1 Tax=Fusarium duplospermum TaxID=1325734 RepID=A0A428PD15_9HYPO|nr:hypothetical protein CEP54_011684 [Fusarium duplospermum]
MHHAAEKGKADVASVMLAKDCTSLKIKDKSGNLPIHYLGRPACEAIFSMFVAAGADKDATDSWGRTLLHKISREGDSDATDFASSTAETASSRTVESSTTATAAASTSTDEISSSETETSFTTVSTTFSTTFLTTASTTASTESISVSTTTTSVEPEETLYLRNGDFDESYDISPWYSALDVANLLMGVVSGMSHDGGHSLRLKFGSRPLYFLANLLNPKALIAEQDYEISAWARFGKEVDDNGEGCTELFLWCMHSEWNFAEKGGDGQLLASADSVNDFVQVKATCRWSQEQLDKNPLLMLRWTCSKTLGWVDSITIEKAGQ